MNFADLLANYKDNPRRESAAILLAASCYESLPLLLIQIAEDSLTIPRLQKAGQRLMAQTLYPAGVMTGSLPALCRRV